MAEQFANNATSLLVGNITNVATSLVVASGTPFPTAGNFRILVESEIMLVTSVSGTTFTVTRAQEGTTGVAHVSGVVVAHILTAGAIAQAKIDGQGWITALDYDFTAQGSQTLASDGPFTIGGVTWTKVNSTHEQSAMTMSAASGLLIQPKGDGSNYNESNWTAPGLQVPLTQIIPTLEFGMQLRVWAYNSANNSAANFDGATLAIDYLTHSNYLMVRGYSSGQYFYISVGNNGSVPSGVAADVTNLTDNVFVMTIPSFGHLHAQSKGGTWSSGFPAANTLHSHASVLQTAIMSNMGLPSNWSASLYGVRVSSGTALQIGWSRLKIEYRL